MPVVIIEGMDVKVVFGGHCKEFESFYFALGAGHLGRLLTCATTTLTSFPSS